IIIKKYIILVFGIYNAQYKSYICRTITFIYIYIYIYISGVVAHYSSYQRPNKRGGIKPHRPNVSI
ncbi:MAG: hypothetical protein N7Q72_04845, partial [Spiroplasma sp. Tabriz.8]|nr:hypothetical protein [Spiroplasma sp. Tabriz.8]